MPCLRHRRDAEREFFALPTRYMERTERPVPDSDETAEVLVEMRRVDRMMHLMVCGAEE